MVSSGGLTGQDQLSAHFQSKRRTLPSEPAGWRPLCRDMFYMEAAFSEASKPAKAEVTVFVTQLQKGHPMTSTIFPLVRAEFRSAGGAYKRI